MTLLWPHTRTPHELGNNYQGSTNILKAMVWTSETEGHATHQLLVLFAYHIRTEDGLAGKVGRRSSLGPSRFPAWRRARTCKPGIAGQGHARVGISVSGPLPTDLDGRYSVHSSNSTYAAHRFLVNCPCLSGHCRLMRRFAVAGNLVLGGQCCVRSCERNAVYSERAFCEAMPMRRSQIMRILCVHLRCTFETHPKIFSSLRLLLLLRCVVVIRYIQVMIEHDRISNISKW